MPSSSTSQSVYLPGLTTTINTAITAGLNAGITAEAIADITSSGATLKANHLKLLSDGVLLKSQASIFASRTADWSRLGSTMKGLCKKMNWKDLVL